MTKKTFYLKYYSGFLQKVRSHIRPNDLISSVKTNLCVLPKTAAVVISGCLCIADGLTTQEQQKYIQVKIPSDAVPHVAMYFPGDSRYKVICVHCVKSVGSSEPCADLCYGVGC